jgi:hypothetical protein
MISLSVLLRISEHLPYYLNYSTVGQLLLLIAWIILRTAEYWAVLYKCCFELVSKKYYSICEEKKLTVLIAMKKNKKQKNNDMKLSVLLRVKFNAVLYCKVFMMVVS